MIIGFSLLAFFYLAYRLNRDEGIIVTLQGRVAELENFVLTVQSDEEISKVEENKI